MWLKLFQIALFSLGVILMAMLLSLDADLHKGIAGFLCFGLGVFLALIGTWVYVRIRDGSEAPTLWELIIGRSKRT